MTTKRTASQLASMGRNGDTMLVHMSPTEFEALNNGLGSLTGAGATINPATGLPEMFNWTSLIPAVVGIGATVLSGGTLSPLAAGMISGAATTAATGDWRQGVMSGITAGAASGIGAGINEMAGAGAASAAGAGAGSGQVMADTAGASMADQALASEAAEGLASSYATAPVDTAMAAAATDGLGYSAVDSGIGEGIGSLGNTGKTFDQAFMGDKFYTRTLPGTLAVGNSIMSGMEPSRPKIDHSDDDEAPTTYKAMHREYTPADPSYTLGSGEPRMFGDPTYTTHRFAQGGLASLNGDADMVQTQRARKLRARYRSKKDVVDDLNRPDSYARELGVTGPDDPILSIAFGFTAKQGKKNISLSPAFAGGGHVHGEGDGMSDDIMTSIDGQQPASLSSDEYVVPADAVSDLGNGSSDAGAQQLDSMVARIRALRHGTEKQPPQVDPMKAMPA